MDVHKLHYPMHSVDTKLRIGHLIDNGHLQGSFQATLKRRQESDRERKRETERERESW